MKNIKNKIITIKKLHDEQNITNSERTVITSNIPENLTPRMRTKISKIETQSPKVKPITTVDDIGLNKHKLDFQNVRKEPITNTEDIINPSSYLLQNGSIQFSKLLIDEVLAADKLLIEAAKSLNDISGPILLLLYLNIYKLDFF